MGYRSFFSYAHADSRIARWLHRQLDSFRTPRGLVGAQGAFGPVPKSLHPIFRDRTDLQAGGKVDQSLENALVQSESLVVLCTPASAKSSWVNQECEIFLTLGRANRLFPVIASGEPDSGDPATECFPPALRGRGILAADLREIKKPNGEIVGDGKDGGRLKLIAGLLGVSLDVLVQRERRRQRQTISALATAAGTFLLLAVAAGYFYVSSEWQKNEAVTARQLAQDSLSRTLEKFTDPQFQEDAALDPLQQTILDQLLPLYEDYLERSRGDAAATAEYAGALDRFAALRWSSGSASRASEAYTIALRALDQAWSPSDASIIGPIRSQISRNYASQLLAYGDYDGATALLADPTIGKHGARESLDCLRFRIHVHNEGFAKASRENAAAVFTSLSAWFPAEIAEQQNRITCLMDLADTFSLIGQPEQAKAAFDQVAKDLDAALVQKPRSVAFHALEIHRHLLQARLDYRSLPNYQDRAAVALALVSVTRAEEAVQKAELLGADSRLLLEATMQTRLASYRLYSSGAIAGASENDVLTRLASWLGTIEMLTKRDPDSQALAETVTDQLARATDIIFRASGMADKSCGLLGERLDALHQAAPESLVANWAIASSQQCYLIAATAAAAAEGVEPDLTKALERVSKSFSVLRSKTEAPIARRKVLAAYFRHLYTSAKDAPDLDLLIRLAQEESAREAESLRYTRLSYILAGLQADIYAGREDLASAERSLRNCVHHSDIQQRACAVSFSLNKKNYLDRIPALANLPDVDGAVAFLDPTVMQRTPGQNFRQKVIELLLTADEPVQLVVREKGAWIIADDRHLTRKYGAEDSRLAYYSAESDLTQPFLVRAQETPIPWTDAYLFFRLGAAMMPAPPQLNKTEAWWATPEGIAYVRPIALIADELRAGRTSEIRTAATTAASPAAVPAAPAAGSPPTQTWKTSQFSRNTTPISIDEALLEEKGVILLQGKNIYGDQIFTYIEISLRELIRLRDIMRQQLDFMPAEYGTVLAAGKGEPSDELRAEMAAVHNMIEVPQPKKPWAL